MTGQGGYRLPEPCGFNISVLQADKVFERSVHRLKVQSSTLDGARSHCAAMALPGYMGSGKHPIAYALRRWLRKRVSAFAFGGTFRALPQLRVAINSCRASTTTPTASKICRAEACSERP